MNATKKQNRKSSQSGSGQGERRGSSASSARKAPAERLAERLGEHLAGLLLLAGVLLVLSVLSGSFLQSTPALYMPGEVAARSVAADQELWVEDVRATVAKRTTVAGAQPVVFDLSAQAYTTLETGVYKVFEALNAASPEDVDQVRWRIAEEMNTEIASSIVVQWRREEFQNLVLGRVLPWAKKYLDRGVVEDSAMMSGFIHGVIVRDLGSGKESLRMDPGALPDMGRLNKDMAVFLKKELKKPLVARKAILALTAPLSTPSLKANADETKRRRELATASLEPEYLHIRQDEIIVRQGEAVSAEQHLKLQALASREADSFDELHILGVFAMSSMLMAGLFLCMYNGLFRPLRNRDFVLLASVMLMFGGLAKFLALFHAPIAAGASLITANVIAFSLPLAGAAGIMALFFPFHACLFTVLSLSFVCVQILGGGIGLYTFYFAGCMVEVFVIKRADTRKELLTSVFPLLGILILAWAGVTLLDYQGLPHALASGAYALTGGVLSLLLVLALSPIIEMLFGYTSRFKLMELMSLEQPLLQELMVGAPGTYHHSLILSNMAEAGARAIGANALRVKVAALYHDIGKLSKPQYFIENQHGGENRHDKLAPSMSALILISHVKQGVEMARANKLGEELCDLIQQHHGTMLISYFHHKAVEQAEAKGEEAVRALSEDEFRYPGPKPQTKEAGLLLLADAIEASSRTLTDPTPSRIKGHIENITKKIFTEGQLDESELTLKDLHLLADTFRSILTGIFHQRIEYPGTSMGKRMLPEEDPDKGAAAKAGKNGKGEESEPPVPAPAPDGVDKPESAKAEKGKGARAKGGKGADADAHKDPTGQTSPDADGDKDATLKFSKSIGKR